MPTAMPCKIKRSKHGETCSFSCTRKTKYACIVEADKKTRMRMEESLPKDHEDHIAGKGNTSLNHYNLVHKFIPMPQATKIPDAKVAAEKEREKLKKCQHGSSRQSETKKTWSTKPKKKCKTVHCASLMDLCHLKNSELEPKHQKYEGRVVLRGNTVKADSGAYAVFTDQSSSASQMAAALRDYQDALEKPPTQQLTPKSTWKTLDQFSRQEQTESQATIHELTSQKQALQDRVNLMNDSEDVQDVESALPWKSIPRSQSSGSCSKSSWCAEPRPKPATWYMELA